MQRFQDIPIKRKLTAIIMIASTVALLLVSAGFVTYELVTFRQTMVGKLSTQAQMIGDRSTAALSFQNKSDAEETLRALGLEKHYVAAALYDEKGNLFAAYRSPQATVKDSFPDRPEGESARFESDRLVVFRPIYAAGNFAGTVCLKSDLQEMKERSGRYAVIILLFMVASWVVTLFLSARLQRVISRPIFHLAETARTVSEKKNYSVRAEKHGADELGQLIDGFNEMLVQIQQRDSKLQGAHDELEARVEERTRDLRDEIAERRRAEAALQQQFVRISLLNQITQAISDRQDTDSILHVVLRQLEDHLGTDLGMVALFDPKAKTLNVAALRVKNSTLAEKFDLREGGVLRLDETDFPICEQGQTVYLKDTIKGATPFSERLAATGWRSAVVVPLMVEDKLFGVLLSARLKADDFSSGDGEFLRMLSEHVALAAHQARLHKDLENAYHELRHSQATVLQQERLKALGQMASGIAHDVNNALSPIVGFADLLLRGEHGLSDNGKKYLKHIRTAGGDIAHIVARLREFYRPREADEALQQLGLNTLVEQVVDMTRPRWRDIPQSSGITIEVQAALAAGVPQLAGIESEIREAITNLVLNAVDAMPAGGKITVGTKTTHHNPGKHKTRVAVEVTDTGMGMDEETRKRCLEPFFSTKGRRGTGLGLAMVYGVMERHEGSVEIESVPGKGSTFRLIFPVRNKPVADEIENDGGIITSPMRILCIDDEPLLRELVKEILERDGHKVEVSDGGQSGLDEFRLAQGRGRPFDIVITDLGMPYVDGRQVAKTLRQESPGTPIVMLTGWGAFMKDDSEQPPQVDCVISKPPRSRELRETLHRFRPCRAEATSPTERFKKIAVA